MLRVFIDSSVLVAACGSKTGASALVLGYCRSHKIEGHITAYAVNEAKKNVFTKMDTIKQNRLDQYLQKASLKYVPPPSSESVEKFSAATASKDVPILAAAADSKTDILVSLDQKHLLTPKAKQAIHPIKILTPGELVKLLDSQT